MTREEMQDRVLNDFLSLPKKRGLIMVGTGGGKTRIAMMAIKSLEPEEILFLSDSIIGRDVTLPAEMEKWNLGHLKDKTKFSTYQTAYKWKKSEVDLSKTFVIADEVDFAMTGKYGEFFKEFSDIDILGMTGYSPDIKLWSFSQYLPLISDIPVIELQKASIVNQYKFVFVQYLLSRKKDRDVVYKKGAATETFKQSENASYLYIRKQEKKYYAKLNEAVEAGDMIEAAKYQSLIDNIIPRMRTELLLTLNSSADVAKTILNEILKEDEVNKVVTFSQRTEQADKISKFTYHGKNDASTNSSLFSKFNSGEIRELSLCSKINRTANMVGLNNCIMESFIGDKVAFIQRTGRMLRLNPEEVATVYILLPYYMEDPDENNPEEEIVCKPTRMVGWAKTMMESIDFSWSKFETRNLTPYKMSK